MAKSRFYLIEMVWLTHTWAGKVIISQGVCIKPYDEHKILGHACMVNTKFGFFFLLKIHPKTIQFLKYVLKKS